MKDPKFERFAVMPHTVVIGAKSKTLWNVVEVDEATGKCRARTEMTSKKNAEAQLAQIERLASWNSKA